MNTLFPLGWAEGSQVPVHSRLCSLGDQWKLMLTALCTLLEASPQDLGKVNFDIWNIYRPLFHLKEGYLTNCLLIFSFFFHFLFFFSRWKKCYFGVLFYLKRGSTVLWRVHTNEGIKKYACIHTSCTKVPTFRNEWKSMFQFCTGFVVLHKGLTSDSRQGLQ